MLNATVVMLTMGGSFLAGALCGAGVLLAYLRHRTAKRDLLAVAILRKGQPLYYSVMSPPKISAEKMEVRVRVNQ